jgi:hypothetical protein
MFIHFFISTAVPVRPIFLAGTFQSRDQSINSHNKDSSDDRIIARPWCNQILLISLLFDRCETRLTAFDDERIGRWCNG